MPHWTFALGPARHASRARFRICTAILPVLLLAGIAAAGPYDTWAKYKTITINTTATGGGANVSGTVTSIPILVRLTTATAEDLLGEALASGADVRFASSDGSTALSYQIEYWSSTEADIWVLVPSVTGNSTTDIRVYWKKSGQSDASSASSVFATSNSYVGVWHLNESGSNTVANYKDATGIYNDSAAAGMTNAGAGQVTGVAGYGTSFDGSASYLGFGAWPGSAAAQTVSFWMKADVAANMSVIDKLPNDGSGVGWNFKARSDGSVWYRVGSETSTSDWQKSGAYSAGTWVHITGTFSGGTENLYINGAAAGAALTGVTKTVNNSTTYLRFGIPSAAVTSEKFDGSLDEVQISSTARSADWIKLSYETQKSSATCVLYGATNSATSTYYWNRNAVLTSSTDFSKAYNWSINADGTGRMPVSSTDDEFSTTSIGASWTCQDSDNNAGTGTCSASTNYGQLTLSGRGADFWNTTTEFTALRRSDITGDFDATVKVVSLTNTNAAAKAGLYMADDFTTLGSGGLAGIAWRGDGKVEFLADTTGTVGTIDYSALTGSAVTAPVWLRLVKSGSLVSGFYRTSQTSAWTQLGNTSTVQSTSTNSQVALVHTAHTSASTGTAVFDNFQGGTALSSSTLNLSFAGTGSNADANATLSANQSAASVDFTGYTGTMNFSSYILTVNSGNATFVSGMTLTPGTGTLTLSGTSGTQVLTPLSGATLPAITHTGASTLQLSTNALNCFSFSQSAGTLDFNSLNLTTIGNFTLTSGTTSSFANLTGRTLTVGGNASFTGQSGNLANLNQGAWTLTVAGTLTADYVNLYGSDASGGSAGTATHSTNSGSNTNWTFSIPATLTNLTKSVRLNFNTTATGANVSGNVANIPLLVRLTSSNFTFTSASNTGADLIFVDKDGTTLYHEVAEWDKANKSAKVWVRVPQVDGNSTTDYITLYYGCDSCTTNAYAISDSVFSGFKGVFHLNAPEAKAYDATSLKNHGTYVSALPNLANGGITTKNAAVFDGNANSYIDVPNESNYDLTTDISLWAWIKVSAFNAAWQAIVTKADNSYRLSRNSSTDGAAFACQQSGVAYNMGGSVNVNDGSWHLVVGTYAGDSLRLYVDGARDGSGTVFSGSVDQNNNDVYIGENLGQTGRMFNGSISEVRIGNSSSVLSSDFIKLSYENQKAGSSLLTAYTTASFQSSKVFKLNTTASGANVSGDVTNFPLLLRITGSSIIDAVQGSGTSAPADIRFLDYDGVTWLDYQVERWDRSLDSAEVWVRVPTVEGNYAGHTITMYYQQASGVTLVDGQCSSCVFQTSNSFVADWHFNTSGTGSRPDATGNSYSLSTNSYSGSELTGGVIAGADSLNGSSQYLNTTATMADWSSGFTYTGWAYWASTGSYARLFDFGNGSASDNVYAGRQGTATTYLTEIYNGATSGGMKTAASSISTGVWGHFAVTISGTTVKMYKNGSLVTNATSTQSIKNITRTNNYLGRSNWVADAYYQGKFDEVAIAGTARDSNWIKLCYQNQRNDASPLFNPSPADFMSTQKYTFNTTKTGANVTGNVTYFPLLVRITGSAIVDAVQNNAPDIRFLDGDGKTWLNYQIERWDKTADSAEVWVRVPQIDGNSDHDYITLYYNDVTNGAVADGQCASCVFSTSRSWKAAWHLNGGVTDAMGGYNGTDNNTSDASGVIAKARSFNGTTSYIDMGNPQIHASTAYSLMAWVKGASGQSDKRIFGEGSTSTTTPMIGIGTHVSGSDGTLDFFYRNDANTTEINHSRTTATAFDGSWHHIAVADSGGSLSVYIDGAFDRTISYTKGTKTFNVFSVGALKRTSVDSYFTGSIDEVDALSTKVSADWVKLAYETQRASGNKFWNSRSGPNNKATLTATATSTGNIALSWGSTVSDSSNADSVGIWVKYAAYPDSVGASSTTFVTRLAKADTTYSYPAAYSGTYYFALAVRNTSGQWSPFTSTSSDTAALSGVSLPDTIYVDSAIGSDANSCASAQNPATPKLTITSAVACGASATDTLVVRVMPGTYASDNSFSITSKPTVVTSFDNNSRAALAGNGTATESSVTYAYAVSLNTGMTLRRMDVKAGATTDKHIGIFVPSGADSVVAAGNRVYGSGSYAFDTACAVQSSSGSGLLIANNLFYLPNKKGVQIKNRNAKINIMHNVFYGNGGGSSQGVGVGTSPANPSGLTITNNIFYNWDYGINAASSNALGTVSGNLFYLVTSGREASNVTDATNSVLKDPLFANTAIGNPIAFKLLPGSPGIDAGTATISTGANAWSRVPANDYFGGSRTLGSAPDIGLYEGTGYTPNPSGEFDTLSVSSTATTITVQNSKWKLVFDQGRGAGITEFYDKTTNPSTNLVSSNTLLFDVKIDSYQASSQTTAGPLLYLLESSRSRAVVRQRLGVSASLNLNVYYSIYPSGHVYVESELANIASGTTTVGTLDYTLKLGTVTTAYTSSGTKNGFGYLLTSTRDVMMAVTRDLDSGASASETWSTSTAASGSPGTLVFNTTDLADLTQNTLRRHDFAIYLGDNSLTFDKAAAINADAYTPSVISMSAGSLWAERSWQDGPAGHWTFDDGGGTSARDKAVTQQHDATVAGSGYKWVSGKVGAALYLTAADSAVVSSSTVLDASTSFTAMFWIKPDFAGMGDTANIVSKGLTTSSGWFFRKVSGANKIKFTMGGATVTSPTLNDGVWTHIAVVAHAGGSQYVEMLVNGRQAGASTTSTTATANATNLVMGYGSGSSAAAKFQGTLDDVRIYRRELTGYEIQAISNRGFSSRYGHYALRADNNNRVVALLNGSAAQTRVQPAFDISNWFASNNPRYVYLNGTRLTPFVDYTCDSIWFAPYGYSLVLQLNKILTGSDQTLFIDDDDSTGYLGSAAAMKTLTVSSSSGKITVKNFSDTVFGSAASGQWYMELGLTGWTTPTATATADSSFGEIHVWKAAAVSPNVAVSSATQLVGWSYKTGQSLTYMKLDASANEIFTAGLGYLSPATNTYTLVDSSSTRLSLTLSSDSLTGTVGTAAVTKRFTFYPTGRVFVSYQVRNISNDFGAPRLDLNPRYDNLNQSAAWSMSTAGTNARCAWINGDLNFHSIGLAMLSVKNATSTYTTGATMLGSVGNGSQFGAANDQRMLQFNMPTSLWTAANKPVTVNFMMDFSKNYKDSATADSLLKDCQNPATLTAITGTRVTNDALDFNSDNFAEGDGAYTYAASGGVAHFKFVNTVASFYPAFRVSSWTQGTLPEFVVLDNQVLTKGYHYNAYLSAAANTVVIQFNKTLAAGTHVFFISHQSGLAVTLNRFEAKGGDGVDTLAWTTESEFENLGFHVWRRPAPGAAIAGAPALLHLDASTGRVVASGGGAVAREGSGSGSQASAARGGAAEGTVPSGRTAAGMGKTAAATPGNGYDTLPSAVLDPGKLAAEGWVRITPKLIPGAPGGASASTREYAFLDRTAAFDGAYEYLLEAVDFNNGRVFYGPRTARPGNPLETELSTNYPNPFNPITTLRFSLREKLRVSLVIYDARGRVVRNLVRPDKPLAAGKYRVIWDARNEGGIEVPSGQYYYRFRAGRYAKTRAMLLIK